jgi:hypothetical protein
MHRDARRGVHAYLGDEDVHALEQALLHERSRADQA